MAAPADYRPGRLQVQQIAGSADCRFSRSQVQQIAGSYVKNHTFFRAKGTFLRFTSMSAQGRLCQTVSD